MIFLVEEDMLANSGTLYLRTGGLLYSLCSVSVVDVERINMVVEKLYLTEQVALKFMYAEE